MSDWKPQSVITNQCNTTTNVSQLPELFFFLQQMPKHLPFPTSFHTSARYQIAFYLVDEATNNTLDLHFCVTLCVGKIFTLVIITLKKIIIPRDSITHDGSISVDYY